MVFARRKSPRERRLNSDFRAIQELSENSSIVSFESVGNPPETYRIFFQGIGVWRVPDSSDVILRDHHEVTVTFTSAYPRMIPEIAWQSPIFHPNISASGVVCLGGYGTHWVPSLMIDELCHMLWDMIRYKNFDIESPYNREAAVWTKNQTMYRFPLDDRPLRNQLKPVPTPQNEKNNHSVSPDPLGSTDGLDESKFGTSSGATRKTDSTPGDSHGDLNVGADVQFIEPSRQPSPENDNDIVFID